MCGNLLFNNGVDLVFSATIILVTVHQLYINKTIKKSADQAYETVKLYIYDVSLQQVVVGCNSGQRSLNKTQVVGLF